MKLRLHIPDKPQRAGIPGFPADRGTGEQGEEVKAGMKFDRET